MLNKEHRQEIVDVLGQEQVERIEAYSVWRERQRYSDAQLWARLHELHARELEIIGSLPAAYQLAHSDVPDRNFWRSHWMKLVLELEADQPVKEAYAWHLSRRGDQHISQWIATCAQQVRDKSMSNYRNPLN